MNELIDIQEKNINRIRLAVEAATGVDVLNTANARRTQKQVFARMIFTHKCLELGIFGDRIAAELNVAEGTIRYYVRKFEGEVRYNPIFAILVQTIENILSGDAHTI